jgi:hypothetical protein
MRKLRKVEKASLKVRLFILQDVFIAKFKKMLKVMRAKVDL